MKSLHTVVFIAAFALLSGNTAAQGTPPHDTADGDSLYLNECPVYIPNAFTPNGDNVNDRFGLKMNPDCEPVEFQFRIFDRWGRLVHDTRHPTREFWWDGTSDGNRLPAGVYVWKLVAKLELPTGGKTVDIEKTGTVVLIR